MRKSIYTNAISDKIVERYKRLITLFERGKTTSKKSTKALLEQ